MKNRSIMHAMFWVCLAGSVYVRFKAVWMFNPMSSIWSDPATQWNFGLHPLDGAPLAAMVPLAYPAWLGIVARITQGGPSAVAIYAGLLSVLTPWIWYRFLRELLPQKWLAQLGWLVFSWLPSWIGIYSYFMAETLLLPLLGLSLWMTWRALRKHTYESFVWASVLWVAAFAVKMTVAPLAAMAWFYLLKYQDKKIRCVLFLLVLLAGVTFPLAYRTHTILGVWTPFGYQGHNRIYLESDQQAMRMTLGKGSTSGWSYEFWSPSMNAEPFAPLSHWRWSRKPGYCYIAVDMNKGSQDWDLLLRQYSASWRTRLKHIFENSIFLVWGTSWPDNNSSHFWEKVSVTLRWMWAPLLVGVGWLNIQRWKRDRHTELLPLMTCIGWFLICVVPVGVAEGRYRKPLEGLLLANAFWLLAARLHLLRSGGRMESMGLSEVPK